MRVLLLYGTEPDQPELFRWTELVRLLAGSHQVKGAWWVLESRPASHPELGAGILTTREFESFDPDLLLFDGAPNPQAPVQRSRRIPWPLEDEKRYGCLYHCPSPENRRSTPSD